MLFSNDPAWAASLTHPSTGPDKTYHVQIDRLPDSALIEESRAWRGCRRRMAARQIRAMLRSGQKNGWLEITLAEGRNRQIRRLLHAFDIAVLRLVSVCIGNCDWGSLAKGGWRVVTEQEIASLAPAAR